ncbi:hypothetical protein DVB69_02650 [Sporosarcina sp. BI001-red]|nr:hypothetical protein DVB69_02650 [Sporosarcina sp. BI001-red]
MNNRTLFVLLSYSEATPSLWPPELDYKKSAGGRVEATGAGGIEQQDAFCPVFIFRSDPEPLATEAGSSKKRRQPG